MEQDPEVKGEGNGYTTPFRQYDPRLGRWMSVDPVTHHQFSPYNAFDNNPLYWTDPSGSNSESPTDFVNEKGETIASIPEDGSDEVFVIDEENEAQLVEELIEMNVTNDIQSAEENARIGEKYGYNIKVMQNQFGLHDDSEGSSEWNILFSYSYSQTRNGGLSWKDRLAMGMDAALTSSHGGGEYSQAMVFGQSMASRHMRLGIMDMFNPTIKPDAPKYDISSMICEFQMACSEPVGSAIYNIKWGDNLTHIARDYDTTISSLVGLNLIENQDLIFAGETLKLR